MIEELFKTLDEEFHARLSLKPGWGCHQVWTVWLEAKCAAFAKHYPDFIPTNLTLDAAAREREFEVQERLFEENEARKRREKTKKD